MSIFFFIQKKFLEDKMNKNRQRMNEVDDIVTENEDLQEALLKKDKTIEELERQISIVVKNNEIHMKKNLEKMKIEYELMARSAVSGKMRKMNEYLNMKLRQQESLDSDKENMSKGIQLDLEERLSNTSNELTLMKKRLESKVHQCIIKYFF